MRATADVSGTAPSAWRKRSSSRSQSGPPAFGPPAATIRVRRTSNLSTAAPGWGTAVAAKPTEGQPDGGVALGPDPVHGPLDGVPVERLHRPYEAGVGATARPVRTVDPQARGVAVGKGVGHGADGTAGAFPPGPPRTVVVGHRAGRVEHHDQAPPAPALSAGASGAAAAGSAPATRARSAAPPHAPAIAVRR
ncbi:hypothetical protein SGL43_03890 [Streptomyces globisporus]|uniref:Uncharacterized protein n=1 Tax=Streptomyces globisporus TaxID=1908 RepID=A0ABM9GZU4_STRGL|nr:hypothetical protein SGL43_03890 [Streptomyces globisporus]